MLTGTLHAGWSRGDITPPRRTLVSGQFHARIADRVVSPLTATALALEVRAPDGAADQAVLVSCDLLAEGVKSDLVAALAGRCPDLDRRKLTLNCTHTHTAPCLASGWYQEPVGDPVFMPPGEYRAWLARRLAEVIAAAWEGRQPARVARGFGYAVVGRCRRAVYADGSALMYGRTDRQDFVGFESCDDHAVNMLYTFGEDGALTGIVANVACPAQCDEGLSAFSADYWHEVRARVAERFGAAVHLLPQCAPAGDLSPHLLADQKEEKDLRDRLGVDAKGIIARRLMAALDEGLQSRSPARATLEFGHEVRTLRLPRLMVTADEYALEKRLPAMDEQERARQPFAFQRLWPFGLVSDLVRRYEQQADHPEHEAETHIIRLGEAAIATNPFELFVDYGRRIRCRSRALQTFLVQLADGSQEGFYLPTQRALMGGHYSALIKSNWVGPEGGQILVDETVSAIDGLFADSEYPRTR